MSYADEFNAAQQRLADYLAEKHAPRPVTAPCAHEGCTTTLTCTAVSKYCDVHRPNWSSGNSSVRFHTDHRP